MKKVYYFFLLWVLLSCVLSLPVEAGFMIKPLKMQFYLQPGQTIEKRLDLHNTGTRRNLLIDLKLSELTQKENGAWSFKQPTTTPKNSNLQSCLKWAKLSHSAVKIKPLDRASVNVSLTVPRNARSFYAAALLALARPSESTKGKIQTVVCFLIPILVEIQGRPVRQKIELTDADMHFFEQSEKNPATTLVSMNIVNKGGTYSRLKGNANVMWQVGEHWQRVASAEFREVGIIPGVELNLKSDLKRLLPSGKYKLKAALYVDGRRVRPLVKEMDFIGDPTVTKVAADISLTLDPSILSIKSVPGGTRAAAIKIRNLSEEAVNVSVDVEVPKSFRGVSLGELKGEDLGCAQWLKVIPDNFTLRAGRHQNIRIIAKLPRSKKIYANYYATLNFHTTYTDGRSAGKNTSLIWLKNAKIKAKPATQIIRVSLAAEEDSRYIIRAKSGNVGNVHFNPKCNAIVTTPDGTLVLETALSGQRQVMLPLEIRDFSEILDFSKVEEGIYRLTVLMDYGEKTEPVSKILPIQVSIEEGEKIVAAIPVNEK